MPVGPDQPEIEFRILDYTDAVQGVLWSMARQAGDELPGHEDLKFPESPELEAAERGAFVAAFVRGQPAASAGYRTFADDPSGETAEVVRMYVNPGSRRSGVGRALLAELEVMAHEDDYRWMVLRARVDQLPAQALYEITGYRRIPGVPDRDGLRTYRKELPSGTG